MRVQTVEIGNYRSCIKTKFSLQNTVTALIGINGVGKTNILQGIQLFKKTNRNRRFYVDAAKGKFLQTSINLTLNLDNKIVFLRAIFYYDTDERNIDEVYFTEIKYRIEENTPIKWTQINSEIFEVVDFLKRKRLSSLPRQFQSESSKFSIQLVQLLSNINYYSATQFSDPSSCPISIELDDYKLSGNLENHRNHQKFLFDLYRAFTSNRPTFTLFLNTVGPNGLELIENLIFYDHNVPSSSYKVRTGGEIQKIENSKKIVVPSVQIDGLSLSPNQLSEGTFKTLALVFYILNDNSELLLIEEPEVCVHHGLLSSIIELIKQQSQKKQIIISTHSDFVLDKLMPENILLISKDRAKGTLAKSLTKSLSKNDYEALKEYLETTGNLGEYWKEGGFEND